LRLESHRYRTNSMAKNKNEYPERTDGSEDRFATVNVPITAVAISNGQNDSGVFELNFRDERYLPFEGAGAISKWKLQLSEHKQFDYSTIADVIMTVRYTALDGGDGLKTAANEALDANLKEFDAQANKNGVFVAFDLSHDLATDWPKFANATGGEAVLPLDALVDKMPYFVKEWGKAAILACEIYLTRPQNEEICDVYQDDTPLTDKAGHSTYTDGITLDNWQLKRPGTKKLTKGLWLVVRLIHG
jgi:hypothetical protein